MTPEEKVSILKEARVWDVIGFPGCIDKLIDLVAAHEREAFQAYVDQVKFDREASVLKAVLAEREACAKVCERLISGDGICADDGVWIHDCAAAIRARNNNG